MEESKEQRLAALRKSISEMSDEELYEAIRAPRNSRRPPPPEPKVARTKKAATPKAKASPLKGIDLTKLTPEQAARLAKIVQDKMNKGEA